MMNLNSREQFEQERLLSKYCRDLYAMYVDYPHKSAWKQAEDDTSYRKALRTLFTDEGAKPALLYLHIPFCSKLCHFCSCHTRATNRYEQIVEYLQLMYRELDLFESFLSAEKLAPDIKEIHLGGGSPTMLHRDDFSQLCWKLAPLADLCGIREFALEIDPRYVTLDDLAYYSGQGINRISFGVQDFDPQVQQAVGRVQPAELIEKLLTDETRRSFQGINFDIMWGLPGQTRSSFTDTIRKVIDLSPDRISLLLLHYAPEVKKNQLLMNSSAFPSIKDRTVLFLDAVQALTESGYVRIGFDHFAKPEDDLVRALQDGTLCWNSLGYTAGRYQDVIGIGTGSSSRVTDSYYTQNVYDQKEYAAKLAAGCFPIFREYQLSPEDIIRRELLHRLRGYGKIDIADFETRYRICFDEYFKDELISLNEFFQDSLISIHGGEFVITEQGRLFTTLICRVFDRYANSDKG